MPIVRRVVGGVILAVGLYGANEAEQLDRNPSPAAVDQAVAAPDLSLHQEIDQWFAGGNRAQSIALVGMLGGTALVLWPSRPRSLNYISRSRSRVDSSDDGPSWLGISFFDGGDGGSDGGSDGGGCDGGGD